MTDHFTKAAERLERLEAENANLRRENDDLKKRIAKLEQPTKPNKP